MPEMGSADFGSAAICWTMCSAIGFTAGPQYPPCDELPADIRAAACNVSRSIPVIELIVLIAESPSARARLAAAAPPGGYR